MKRQQKEQVKPSVTAGKKGWDRRDFLTASLAGMAATVCCGMEPESETALLANSPAAPPMPASDLKDIKITKVDRILFKTHWQQAETPWTRIWKKAHGEQWREAHMMSHDTWAILRIETNTGHVGAWTGGPGTIGPSYQKSVERRNYDVDTRLLGRDPFHREAIWQETAEKTWMDLGGAVDVALWDLAGQITGLPSHKLAGQCRDRIATYVTTPLNFGTPEEYAAYAVACKKRGYQAYKIHPYSYYDPKRMRPDKSVKASPDYDIEICRLCRQAVGPDYPLMLDAQWVYEYDDALRVGREIEKLGFVWYESPMMDREDKHWPPYAELTEALDIPILAPEVMYGHTPRRMQMMKMEACDMMRIDPVCNGITASLKMAAICEAWPMPLEMHGDFYGNFTVLAATNEETCKYLEWWDLDPEENTPSGFAKPETHLSANMGKMDRDGYFAVPTRPGIGYEIDWDFVYANRIN